MKLSSKSPSSDDNSELIYKACSLDQYGLSEQVFEYAFKGYEYLTRKGIVERNYLTICDLSQSSLKKRFYIIDIQKHVLVVNTYVAHGKNSGLEYATHFSNNPESLQSSLGFYQTGNTYIGAHGVSLRLSGLENGFNDKAFERGIVIHGATYVSGARAHAAFMGRSFGCPAVPQAESGYIINTIKNGSCLFIYHPSGEYLKRSKILNG